MSTLSEATNSLTFPQLSIPTMLLWNFQGTPPLHAPCQLPKVPKVTAPKINMEPKNHPIEKEQKYLPKLHFWVPCWFLHGVNLHDHVSYTLFWANIFKLNCTFAVKPHFNYDIFTWSLRDDEPKTTNPHWHSATPSLGSCAIQIPTTWYKPDHDVRIIERCKGHVVSYVKNGWQLREEVGSYQAAWWQGRMPRKQSVHIEMFRSHVDLQRHVVPLSLFLATYLNFQ